MLTNHKSTGERVRPAPDRLSGADGVCPECWVELHGGPSFLHVHGLDAVFFSRLGAVRLKWRRNLELLLTLGKISLRGQILVRPPIAQLSR